MPTASGRGVRWRKTGRFFEVDGQQPWMAHHSSPPAAHLLDDDRLRVYFGARDADGRTRTGFVDTDPGAPEDIVRVAERPALDLGRRGAFDDAGAMPSQVLTVGSEDYLYYTGWMVTVSVPYRNAIGLAVSTDGGETFTRPFEGPVVDRTRTEPWFVITPFVLREAGGWRMWYASATGWVDVEGRPEPVYTIKYAESDDGIEWRQDNLTCITQRTPEEAIGRPWVTRDGDGYRMWFACRGSRGFRTDTSESYRIGYAESPDGFVWERRDDDAGIDVSQDGWDSEMVTYPSVYEHAGLQHLLYCGNGFGRSGIGHAVEDR
jgi:hypothetical protein